jgi:hypothetical protein
MALARLQRAADRVGDGVGIEAAEADGVAQGDGGADGQHDGGDQGRAGQARELEDAGQHVQQAVAPEPAQALFQRPGGRRPRGRQQAGERQKAHHADAGAQAQVAALGGRIGLRDASHAEDQHQQGRAPAGQAHRLDHDVGDRRAGAAQGVGGLDVSRGVQAGIGGVIGGDGQQQAAPTTVIRPPRNRADQG